MAKVVLGQAHRAVEDAMQVHATHASLVVATEGAQGLDDHANASRTVARTSDRRADLGQCFLGELVGGHCALHRLERKREVPERVVDLVRDAGREPSQGREPVGEDELLLNELPLRDVARVALHAAVGEHRSGQLNVDGAPVLAPQRAFAGDARPARAVRADARAAALRGNEKLAERGADQLFARASGHLARRGIHLEQHVCGTGEEDRVGGLLDERAVTLLATTNGLLGGAAALFFDLARRLRPRDAAQQERAPVAIATQVAAPVDPVRGAVRPEHAVGHDVFVLARERSLDHRVAVRAVVGMNEREVRLEGAAEPADRKAEQRALDALPPRNFAGRDVPRPRDRAGHLLGEGAFGRGSGDWVQDLSWEDGEAENTSRCAPIKRA